MRNTITLIVFCISMLNGICTFAAMAETTVSLKVEKLPYVGILDVGITADSNYILVLGTNDPNPIPAESGLCTVDAFTLKQKDNLAKFSDFSQMIVGERNKKHAALIFSLMKDSSSVVSIPDGASKSVDLHLPEYKCNVVGSRDLRSLVVNRCDKLLYLYNIDGDLSNQKAACKLSLISKWQAAKSTITGLALSPDATNLFVSASDSTVSRWRISSKKPEFLYKIHIPALYIRDITSAISPDGKYLAVVAEDGAVMLYNAASGNKIKILPTPFDDRLHGLFWWDRTVIGCWGKEGMLYLINKDSSGIRGLIRFGDAKEVHLVASKDRGAIYLAYAKAGQTFLAKVLIPAGYFDISL